MLGAWAAMQEVAEQAPPSAGRLGLEASLEACHLPLLKVLLQRTEHPYISPTSPLYLPYTSPIPPLYLPLLKVLLQRTEHPPIAAAAPSPPAEEWHELREESPNPDPNPNPHPHPSPNPNPNPNPNRSCSWKMCRNSRSR